jgi:hypothetical protein
MDLSKLHAQTSNTDHVRSKSFYAPGDRLITKTLMASVNDRYIRIPLAPEI